MKCYTNNCYILPTLYYYLTQIKPHSKFMFACSFLWLAIELIRRRLLWSQVVVLWIKVACSAPELKGKPGPESRVVAAGVEVPTGAPRRPDGALHPLLHLRIECLLNLGPYLDSLHVSPLHRAQAVQDVVDLRLDHEDNGSHMVFWASGSPSMSIPSNSSLEASYTTHLYRLWQSVLSTSLSLSLCEVP